MKKIRYLWKTYSNKGLITFGQVFITIFLPSWFGWWPKIQEFIEGLFNEPLLFSVKGNALLALFYLICWLLSFLILAILYDLFKKMKQNGTLV